MLCGADYNLRWLLRAMARASLLGKDCPLPLAMLGVGDGSGNAVMRASASLDAGLRQGFARSDLW